MLKPALVVSESREELGASRGMCQGSSVRDDARTMLGSFVLAPFLDLKNYDVSPGCNPGVSACCGASR